MARHEGSRIAITVEIKPHAYDPMENWELFDGVLPRRLLAFAIDVAVILAPVALAGAIVILLGFATFGLGWGLRSLLYPATAVWALVYYGATLAGPASATIGMRAVDIELRTWYGAPCYFLLGAAHALALYVSLSALTPLVLAAGLFNARQRLLHDFALGTVAVNNARRAAALCAAAAMSRRI